MISNKKHFFLLFILMLALAACSGDETANETAEQTVATQPAAAVPTVEEPIVADEPTQEPAADAPTLEPTPTEAQATAEIEPETAEPQPTAAEAEAEQAPPAEPQFNGRYETTYFRGSETAPVMMIDYSDFL
jgi:hypothetical protein